MGKELGFFGLMYLMALVDPRIIALGFVCGILSRRWWQASLGGAAAGSALWLYNDEPSSYRLMLYSVGLAACISLSLFAFAAKRGLLGDPE